MNKKDSIKCIVIGSDNLTLQCMTMLLEKKQILLGVISCSESIKEWCIVHSIRYFQTVNDFEKDKSNLDVDVLFSIVNEQILSSSILEYPKIGAINYHNSPLPKYAGLYATSWAILNGEVEHAITWHWMESKVDAGDILKQLRFSIDPEDTALTLNLKCYEYAVHAFSELIDELATNTVSSVRQDLTLRTYNGLKDKPKDLGFICFEDSARQIERLCRALYFGPYRNELATPKVMVSDQIVIVQSCKKLSEKSPYPAGVIVDLRYESLQVSTKTTDVLLFELVDLWGNQWDPLSSKIKKGQRLTKMDKIGLNRLANHDVIFYSRYEKYWVDKYKKCIEHDVTFLSRLRLLDPNSDEPYEITEIKFSKEVLSGLANLSQTIGVQEKHVVMAILLIYWYRLNNYKNFSVSYHSAALQESINANLFLSQKIPFTTILSDEMTFHEVLIWMRDELDQLENHHTYLLDIFIRYPEISTASNAIDLAIGFYESYEKKSEFENHKISVNISEDGSGLQFCNRTNYKSQVSSFAFFTQFKPHFLNLCMDVNERPNSPLFELKFLGEEEKNLFEEWNKTDFEYDKTKLLHHYFEEQAQRTPLAIAAMFDGSMISYEDLNQNANRIACYLIKQNISQNDVIGIYAHRNLDVIACIVGILKAGAAYLPLDMHYPSKRIEYMLHHSQTKLVLTNQDVVKLNLNDYHGAVVNVLSILNRLDLPCETPKVKTNHEDLAYIIYTSGTTGTPKGVAITHRSACNHMVWMKDTYDFSEQDTFLLKTPFSFDASVWEIFIPLFVGAKLIVSPEDAHMSPEVLIQLIQHNQVNIIQLVPSMLRELIASARLSECSSLRHVFCGGEVLLQEIIHAFMENNRYGVSLHNLYGPTEATIDAVTLTCTQLDVLSMVNRIGRPIYNTRLLVLDERMQLMPIGVLGELYILGDCLAKGYLNNSDLTNQKFMQNPFSLQSRDRVYRTGDLVKWQHDGLIEYHGRTDDQIKIRGFRIEVSEIESCLEKHPKIGQCLVKPELNRDGSMALSAYFTVTDEQLTAADIRSVLKNDIPDYMVPTRYFLMDRLPTTPSGKLDRRTKLQPKKQLYFAKEPVLPRTQIEMMLHQIWCDVLEQNDLGIHDDFFELGGQSLLAMQMVSKIKKELLVRIPIRAFFNHPTIYSLSKEIEQLIQYETDHIASCPHVKNSLIPIKKTGSRHPLFLVHPVGGSVFWYTSIGQYLDADIPLYGLQDPGIEAKEFIFESIENMAHTYIQVIRTIQPNGPYLVGGASFGTTVALEMARQLSAKGELIDAIISLDGWAVYPTLQSNESYFRTKMRIQNEKTMANYLKYQVPDPDFLLELQWHREQLLTNYQLPMIHSKFILFKASSLSEVFHHEAPLNWWNDYITHTIQCHMVPGDHETMFIEPHVKILSMKLNKCLKGDDSGD